MVTDRLDCYKNINNNMDNKNNNTRLQNKTNLLHDLFGYDFKTDLSLFILILTLFDSTWTHLMI